MTIPKNKIMKILKLFSLAFLPGMLMSQEIKFSVLTGPGISWISSNDNQISSSGIKISYKAHVQAEYWFNDRYAATGGIGLSLGQGGHLEFIKGGDLWKEAELSDTKYKNLPDNAILGYRMNYIDIPFGFKLRTNEFGKFRFYVHAPEFCISLRTRARGTIEAPPLPDTEGEDIRKMVSFFGLFYGIGLGGEMRISADVSLVGGLRFYQSFTDITDDSGRYSDGTREDSKGILSSLDFRFGVIF